MTRIFPPIKGIFAKTPLGIIARVDTRGNHITVPFEHAIVVEDIAGATVRLATDGNCIRCEAITPESSAPQFWKFEMNDDKILATSEYMSSNAAESLEELIWDFRVALAGRW